MTYRQKLTKIGNSVGILLPKNLRDILGVDVGSEIVLEVNEEAKTLTFSRNEQKGKVDPHFFELMKSVTKQYSAALKELASK